MTTHSHVLQTRTYYRSICLSHFYDHQTHFSILNIYYDSSVYLCDPCTIFAPKTVELCL